MRGQSIAKVVMFLVLLGVAGVLAFFCVQNANRYWEANHPPDDAELVDVTVLQVETEELCGRTSKSTSSCTTEVDGLEFVTPDGETRHVDAHAVFSPGDEVQAFQDSDGDWQVKGSFTKGWAARTAGFTGIGALVFLVLAVGSLRPARAQPDQAELSQAEPDQTEPDQSEPDQAT
jgi:hypothetical protein